MTCTFFLGLKLQAKRAKPPSGADVSPKGFVLLARGLQPRANPVVYFRSRYVLTNKRGSLGFRMVEPKSTANGANSREKK